MAEDSVRDRGSAGLRPQGRYCGCHVGLGAEAEASR